ncbi:MAG: amino acid adenylation domain-containing protein [Atopobiaceae bacterium]|jgi:D-alanine--poly(phosphoribitol) ligase subunit 1
MKDEKDQVENVLAWLEASAVAHPDKVAFQDEKNALTYAHLQQGAKSIGTSLVRAGSMREPVAILVPRGVLQPLALFGAIYAGGPYVVLDGGSPRERLVKIVSAMRPSQILCVDETRDLAESLLPGRCLDVRKAQTATPDEALLSDIRLATSAHDTLYVLFTSGSTGTPKGVVVSHANVISYVSWFAQTFDITPATVFGSQTPFYFSMSVSDVFSCIRQGATMQIISRTLFSFPVRLVEFLNERKVNTLYWVPTALSIFSRWDVLSVAGLEHVQKVLFAGEVMPTPTLNYWMDHLPNAQFANLFGPTETTDICTYYQVDRRFDNAESLPIGRVCKGLHARIVKEDGTLAAPGEEGELYISGPFVAKGYLNDARRTMETFVEDPLCPGEKAYRTGDIVRLGEDGNLRYVSRKDAQIKRSGYRIELGEVEAACGALPDVGSCAAIFEAASKKIVLFCTGKQLNEDNVMRLLYRRLPRYMVPDKIELMRSLPLNRNGKIDRKALAAQEMSAQIA